MRTIFLLALLLSACTAGPPPVTPPGPALTLTPTPMPTAAPTLPPGASIGDLAFKPLTEEMWSAIALTDAERYTFQTAAPYRYAWGTQRGAGLDSGAVSGEVQAGFLDTGEQPDLTLRPRFLLGAELPPGGGAYLDRVLERFKPRVEAWAPDARFSTAFMLPPPEPYGLLAFDEIVLKNVHTQRWPAVFVSVERQEVLSFWPRGERNFVYLTHWDAPPARAHLDADQAYALWATALATPGFQAQEEREGHDLFLGRPVPAPPPLPAETQPLYEAPARALTTVELRREWGRDVWELRAENPLDLPCVHTYDDRAASGLVDAETGVVIRFKRGSRTTSSRPNWCPGDPSPPATSAPPP